MNELDELLKLATDASLDERQLLDEVFARNLVNLFNWIPAYDSVLRLRGQEFADSMLFNLATRHTHIALNSEGEELSRQLHGIRAILDRHPDVNFAYARWLTAEDGRKVLEELAARMDPDGPAPATGSQPN